MRLILWFFLLLPLFATASSEPPFEMAKLLFDEHGGAYFSLSVPERPDGEKNPNADTAPLLIRLRANGAREVNFGQNGVIAVGAMVRASGQTVLLEGVRISAVADGSKEGALVAGTYRTGKTYGAFVLKVDKNGDPDEKFGVRGVALLPGLLHGRDDSAFGVQQLADGAVVLALHLNGKEHALTFAYLNAAGVERSDGTPAPLHFVRTQLPGGNDRGDWWPDSFSVDGEKMCVSGSLVNDAREAPFVRFGTIQVQSSLLRRQRQGFAGTQPLEPEDTAWLGEGPASFTFVSAKTKRQWLLVEGETPAQRLLYEFHIEDGKQELVGGVSGRFGADLQGTFFVVDDELHLLRSEKAGAVLYRFNALNGNRVRVSGPYKVLPDNPSSICSQDLQRAGERVLEKAQRLRQPKTKAPPR